MNTDVMKSAVRAGRPMSRWHRVLAAVLRGFYFGRIPIVGAMAVPAAPRAGRLVVCSHRNGAIDGYQVLRAFPRVQFLVSVQLLRHPFLRLMFAGIPVVRAKDRARYGIESGDFGDPVQAGCAHLRAGGELAIFPEGSSEWGSRPRRYQHGAARIARRLMDEGVDLEVVPAGLFYAHPDRFRSRAEVYVGAPVALPQQEGRSSREWERAIHDALASALDAVSVACRDQAHLEEVERQALASAGRGGSYAEAFLRAQRETAPPVSPAAPPRRGSLPRTLGLACMALLWPLLLAGWLAGRKADGRNTVTFFRMAGGLAVGLVWVPCVAAAALAWPGQVVGMALLAAFGWWLLGRGELRA